jgi:hypothetical protein
MEVNEQEKEWYAEQNKMLSKNNDKNNVQFYLCQQKCDEDPMCAAFQLNNFNTDMCEIFHGSVNQIDQKSSEEYRCFKKEKFRKN